MNRYLSTTPAFHSKSLGDTERIDFSKLSAARASKKALELFHAAAERVPAYKAFLKAERVDHMRVRTIADFSAVPITDPKNYIGRYPIETRCWDGDITATQLIAMSSGTTGDPKFWPRDIRQDVVATTLHEYLYRIYFNIQKKSTLVLIGFPMGVYVSGIATLLPTWLSAFKKYRMTIMSIGNHKREMLRAVQNLSDHYEQTILIGHPFFIKDVIESGVREGIAWSHKGVGMMFCSEGFSEAWREYMIKKAGLAAGPLRIFNTYGSSEMLLMGYETIFSVRVKKLAEERRPFLKSLTGGIAAPQFFQYDPGLRYIESVNKELVYTSRSGIPLIRFNLHDRGEIYTADQIVAAAKEARIGALKQSQSLVALWGRSDQTIKFYAANIYPEHIKAGLGTPRFLKQLTGKFTLRKGYLKNMDEFLEVNIELQPGVSPSRVLAGDITNAVVEKLEKINLEYKFLREHLEKDIVPRITLWKYGDEKYFKPGLKPRFIDAEIKTTRHI